MCVVLDKLSKFAPRKADSPIRQVPIGAPKTASDSTDRRLPHGGEEVTAWFVLPRIAALLEVTNRTGFSADR
jgi:hypothetical protein